MEQGYVHRLSRCDGSEDGVVFRTWNIANVNVQGEIRWLSSSQADISANVIIITALSLFPVRTWL
jgi:hypothetical protein